MHNTLKNNYENYYKRVFDVTLSLIAFIIISPLLLIIGLFVRIKLGSPVVFKQARPGKDEKIFYLYKFRSMTDETGEDGRLLPDVQRLTKFGRFLRASSFDELLELVNIIKGDMSIVGPRPLSIYYLPHYSKENRIRHNVRPGLTGLAQVNGRNNLDWDERFALDVQYVQNITFSGDIKSILTTIMKVLGAKDINIRGASAVKDFGPYCVLKEEGAVKTITNNMTYSEIGSFFWLRNSVKLNCSKNIEWLPSVSDSAFTFSGRAAIEIALRDILNSRNVRKVYAPAYCCISMLQSFIDHGLEIQYYDVRFENGTFHYDINYDHKCDIVIIMNYFGIRVEQTHEIIKNLYCGSAVIIEDVTHSLLSGKVYSCYSDYIVVSLRKWFAVPTGGWLAKVNGQLSVKPNLSSNHTVEDKIQGMKEKEAYISGKIMDKEHFLLTNAKFENDLIHVDRMLKLDDTSYEILCGTDVKQVMQQRRKNAEILLHGLKEFDEEMFILPEFNLKEDTPLFVPILLEEDKRDSLRRYLIDRGIYCPIHWPEIMGAPICIRQNELSLVCDQRYSEKDMKAIVGCIKEWVRSNKAIEEKESLHI